MSVLVTAFLFMMLWHEDAQAQDGKCRIPKKVRWLIYVYIAADNDLSDEAEEDFNAMSSALIADSEVAIVVFLDRRGTSDDGYYKIQPGTALHRASQKCASGKELQSAQPSALRAFLDWWQGKIDGTPSRALLMFGHAEGFYLGNDEVEQFLRSLTMSDSLKGAARTALRELVLTDRAIDELGRELTRKSGQPLPRSLLDALHGRAARVRRRLWLSAAVSPLDESDSSPRRSNREFAEVLHDHEFDLLIFDMCFLGTLEAAYEFRTKANVMVASVDITSSWPIGDIVGRLQGTPSWTAELFASDIVATVGTHQRTTAQTLTAVRLGEVDRFVGSLDSLAVLLDSRIGEMFEMRKKMSEVATKYPLYIVDIGVLLDKLDSTFVSGAIHDQVVAVRTAKSAMGIKNYSADRHAPVTGLAVYFPPNGDEFCCDSYTHYNDNAEGDYVKPRRSPSTISFVNDHRWANFLNAYAAGTRSKPCQCTAPAMPRAFGSTSSTHQPADGRHVNTR